MLRRNLFLRDERYREMKERERERTEDECKNDCVRNWFCMELEIILSCHDLLHDPTISFHSS